MTVTVEELLAVTKRQIGTVEAGGPHGNDGNITKYWADLIAAHLADPSFQGQPWCAGVIEWEDWKAGAPRLPIQNPYYCPSRVAYAKSHGLWDESGRYHPGDEVFFCFDGSGVAEHVERVISDDGVTITTVGGNTSPEGSSGSQANGGGTYERHRPHGPTVLGVLAYSRLLSHAQAPAVVKVAPRHPIQRNPYHAPKRSLHLHCVGNDVKWLQWAVGLHGKQIDGEFGRQTLAAVLHFQRYHKDTHGRPLVADGVAGPLTIAVAARVTH